MTRSLTIIDDDSETIPFPSPDSQTCGFFYERNNANILIESMYCFPENPALALQATDPLGIYCVFMLFYNVVVPLCYSIRPFATGW